MPNADLEGEFKDSHGWTSLEVKNARKFFRCTYFGGISSGYLYLIVISAFDVLIRGPEDVSGEKAFLFLVAYPVSFVIGFPLAIIHTVQQKRKYSVRKFIAKKQMELRSWQGNPLFVSIGMAIFVIIFVIFDMWFQNPTEFDLVFLLREEKGWTLLAVIVFCPVIYLILRFTWNNASKLIKRFS